MVWFGTHVASCPHVHVRIHVLPYNLMTEGRRHQRIPYGLHVDSVPTGALPSSPLLSSVPTLSYATRPIHAVTAHTMQPNLMAEAALFQTDRHHHTPNCMKSTCIMVGCLSAASAATPRVMHHTLVLQK